ncbi:MAG: transaldolase, partial [Armatimonadota bacterium]|nr:transaldolase [Armatimonadota bacterium]
MEIFIDSSSRKEIQTWLEHGVVDGVTTNPSILLKDGCRDLKAGALEICQIANPLPVSVEVTSNNLDEMVRQGRQFAEWAGNVVVKIPIINEHGDPALRVIKTLSNEGIKINVTACLSYGQAIL